MLDNFKAFIGSTLGYAAVGVFLTLMIGVPVPFVVVLVNGLLLGAIVSVIGLAVNVFLIKGAPSQFKPMAISMAIASALVFLLFYFTGLNAGSLIGLIVSAIYGVPTALVGSQFAGMKFEK